MILNNISVPVNTIYYTPYDQAAVRKLLGERKAVIYGAGRMGRAVSQLLKSMGVATECYIDKSNAYNATIDGIPVFNSEWWLQRNYSAASKSTYFVFFTTSTVIGIRQQKAMLEEFAQEGIAKRDYITVWDLFQIFPAVDISGRCNLKCISCVRGNTMRPMEDGGMMSAELFGKIMAKLKQEIPFFFEIELYLWGEPMLNPELPQIIDVCTSNDIKASISTNLNIGRQMASVVKSKIEEIRVGISGYGPERYEVTHAGAKWDVFYGNLIELSKLREKYSPETNLILTFHVNKLNVGDFEKIRKLASELGYMFDPINHYVMQNNVFELLQGEQLPQCTMDSLELLTMPLEEQLEKLKEQSSQVCLSRRGFPSIAWDGSVYTCSSYAKYKIADDYLSVPLQELIERRNNCQLCKDCIKHCLHRYPLRRDVVSKVSER
jgi:MoaA/NifB/PqqE/SkfB family radical SAM enzyme